MMTYLSHRAELLTAMRWQFGAVLPPEVKLNMCEPETAYFSGYNKALASYMRRVGTDLTTDISPPKSLYIEVRVLEDHGELETGDGEIVQLKRGTQHHLPRELCEQLIRQGILDSWSTSPPRTSSCHPRSLSRRCPERPRRLLC